MSQKEKPTTKTCKHCGTEIPYSAKICPNCRKKQGMGLLMKIVIVIVVLAILGSFASKNGGDDKSATTENTSSDSTVKATDSSEAANTDETEAETQAPIEYTQCDIKTMKDELDSNALKAKETYKDQYIEITGRLSNIDAGGKYIDLVDDDPYAIIGVQCYINGDEQKAQVANMTKDCTVTLRGKITEVGDILGYSLSVDSIDGYEASGEAAAELPMTEDGYISVSADELVDALETNALGASNTYEKQKLSVSGTLGAIDSDGKYITIRSNDPYSFTNIQCYIKNDDQKSKLMELTQGAAITVKGKCTGVGEILGYSIDIESIE